MKREKISRAAWDGYLYPVNDNKDKIMICMTGSDGGLSFATYMARFLQEHDIPALAFGYFKTKHTNSCLNEIPLETLLDAVAWLKENGYRNIGMQAVSKGSEYALTVAAMCSDVSCVIVKSPSYFCSEGLCKKQPSGSSCWSYLGKAVPYTPYAMRSFNVKQMLWDAKELNILSVNTHKDINPDSIIPVENIQAPILILSAETDTVWPSKENSERIAARLKDKGFSYPYEHITYTYMSHMMSEYMPSYYRYIFKTERGYPEECKRERMAMGEKVLSWIHDVWM